MSVRNSVTNVAWVVRKILSLTSLFFVIFLKSISGNCPLCNCCSIEENKFE
jgi:hypothetical protein